MKRTLYHFHFYLLKYWPIFGVFLFVKIISVITGSLAPYFYKLLIENVTQNQPLSVLVKLLIIFAGIRIVANLLEVLSAYLGDRALCPAAQDVRIAVFKKIQDLDFAYHVNKNTGSLISAFKRGDSAYFSYFDSFYQRIISIVIGIITLGYFFSQVSIEILLIIIVIAALNGFFSWILLKRNLKTRQRFNTEEDSLSGIITDNLINYETVKLFAQEKKEEQRLKKSFRSWLESIYNYADSFRLIDITIGTVSGLGILLILYRVILMMKAGQTSTGDFVMVASFVTGFYYQFFDLIWNIRGIAKHSIDLEKYLEILDLKTEIIDPEKPILPSRQNIEIDFKNVCFAYQKSTKKVLNNINLTIPKGKTVALVGKSGAGKTTIIKLLLRFYDPTSGQITFGGQDIRKFTKSSLRSIMGVVPQEPVLFNNSLGFNVSYGRPRATKREVDNAIKMANLKDFVNSLPDKYETQVGERGIKLSGGQKQRLAIARALLADPKIIIFDEATSNLDSKSEKLIQDSLKKIAKTKTLIIIAHRLSTIKNADIIVVMKSGRIVEQGNHEELLSLKNGIYQDLWKLQSGATSPASAILDHEGGIFKREK